MWISLQKQKGSSRSNVYTAIPLALAVLIIGVFAVNKKMVANKDMLTHKWDSKYVAREMGVLYYHYNDLKEYLTDEFSKLAISLEEVQEILDDVPNQVKSDNYGIAKDSNLIVIQVEALQDFIINVEIIGKFMNVKVNTVTINNIYNKIPLIINTPHNLVQGLYENTIGQINMLPMILDLLGIESNYMLGANTLIEELVPVVFRNGNIIYSNYFYDKNEDKVYNTETYEEVSKDSISDVIEEGLKKLQLSDSILKYDIFGK